MLMQLQVAGLAHFSFQLLNCSMKYTAVILCCLLAVALAGSLTRKQRKSVTKRHNYWRQIDTDGKAPPLVSLAPYCHFNKEFELN